MKVLLVSNIPQGMDNVVTALNTDGATVVTKEINANAKDMAKQAYDLFTNGNFDMIIAITDNSVAANIAFNKFDGTNAAVCETVDDASLAKENDANVIIIRDPESANVPEILEVVSKRSKFKIGNLRQAKVFSRPRPVAPKRQDQPEEEQVEQSAAPVQQTQGFGFLKPKPQQQQPQPRPMPSAPIATGPRREGVMGWLKDELGIIDKPHQQPPPQAPQSTTSTPANQTKKGKDSK